MGISPETSVPQMGTYLVAVAGAVAKAVYAPLLGIPPQYREVLRNG